MVIFRTNTNATAGERLQLSLGDDFEPGLGFARAQYAFPFSQPTFLLPIVPGGTHTAVITFT